MAGLWPRNEYQEYLLGHKSVLRRGDKLATNLHVPIVLEQPMPAQARTVIPLLFVIHLFTCTLYKLIYPYSGYDGI